MQVTSRRVASVDDVDQVLSLWRLLYDDMDAENPSDWEGNARAWIAANVEASTNARVVVVELNGEVVACALGTVELGAPNPFSPTGKAVRLSNVVTAPEYRGRGFGTELTQQIIAWARGLGADRIDLSTSPDGRKIYERAGFSLTSAPRMKLEL